MELVLKPMNCCFFGRGSCARCFASRGMFDSSRPRGGSWNCSPVPPRTGIVEEALFAAGCWSILLRPLLCFRDTHERVHPWIFFASVGWAGCSGVYVLRFTLYPRNVLPSWHSWYLGVRFVPCSGISAAHMHPCRHLVEFGALWQSISAAAVSVDL